VQGCNASQISLPALKSYTVTLDLQGTAGTQGFEVIGATKSQRLELPATGPT
jgi:hypothetical protein